mmetsp:Transcript_4152/g.16111  ORF Transcript_4152/g.16111 Transcript_4152/m.16111 type:complete len:310 (+) Transcript_4152:3524-4453(+)
MYRSGMRDEQSIRAQTEELVARRCTSGTTSTARSSTSKLKAMLRNSRRTGALTDAAASAAFSPAGVASLPSFCGCDLPSPSKSTKSLSTSSRRQRGSRRSRNASLTQLPSKSRTSTSLRSVALILLSRSFMLSVESGGPWWRRRTSSGSSPRGLGTAASCGTTSSAGASKALSGANGRAAAAPSSAMLAGVSLLPTSRIPPFGTTPFSCLAWSSAAPASAKLATASILSRFMRRSSAHSRLMRRCISSSANTGDLPRALGKRKRNPLVEAGGVVPSLRRSSSEFFRRRLINLEEARSPRRRAVPRMPDA